MQKMSLPTNGNAVAHITETNRVPCAYMIYHFGFMCMYSTLHVLVIAYELPDSINTKKVGLGSG